MTQITDQDKSKEPGSGFTKFFIFRYLALISVISSLLGSALMFFIGAFKTYAAFNAFFQGGSVFQVERFHEHETSSRVAIATLIAAVDAYLFALVLLIFAYGIYHLFIYNQEQHPIFHLPQWARITNFSELKTILAEVIIVILFVEFLESVINVKTEWLPWEGLVVPFAIVLLAGALKFMH